jgi:membrane protein implicated in regulation of membrane protease activity
MKRNQALILFLGFISLISGYMMSKASLIGKVGMSLFYREYKFLKTWWKGTLFIFIMLLVVYFLHRFMQQRLTIQKARSFHLIACIVAVVSLYLTYHDFRHTLSHRLLGERFHLGVYLFWLGWIAVSLSHLVQAGNEPSATHRDPSPSENISNERIPPAQPADDQS